VHHALAERGGLSEGLEQLPVINLDDESLDIQAWIRPTIEPVVDEVMSYRGPCLVLHGDPAREAFLIDDRDRIGVIDWAAIWYGPVLYDIASLQMYAGGDFAEVLLGYLSIAPEIESELKHLDLFWRFRWSIQAAYFAWRIANEVMTGIDDRSENDIGLNDAKRILGG
jgi:homoserine kinase type II